MDDAQALHYHYTRHTHIHTPRIERSPSPAEIDIVDTRWECGVPHVYLIPLFFGFLARSGQRVGGSSEDCWSLDSTWNGSCIV